MSPAVPTSQPTFSRVSWRAVARHVKCAIWQPVVTPTDVPAGRPRSSTSQRAATSSIAEVAGLGAARAVF
jgi:hypothetical protein